VRIPPHLLEWQARLDVAALRKQNVAGMTGPAGRAPPGHYHGVERWFQADANNTCTTVGCHEPLPHSQKMKVPAFANFHTTFLACQMCHTEVRRTDGQPAAVTWISTSTGAPQDLPPILALLRFLDARADLIAHDPIAADRTIEDLLQRTLDGAGSDPALEALLAQFQSSSPTGPVWRQTVDLLMQELPLHARGEYAAKLAPVGARDPSSNAAQTLALQTASYLAAPAGAERDRLRVSLHAPLLKEAASCVACHTEEAPLLNFDALGYSTQRGKSLRSLPLAHLMQRIREGERFYIPQILEAK
jgi:mono/diheme cytochrome c family protein